MISANNLLTAQKRDCLVLWWATVHGEFDANEEKILCSVVGQSVRSVITGIIVIIANEQCSECPCELAVQCKKG